MPDLLATPAAVRFVSAEPLLGPIDFTQINYGTASGFQVVRDSLKASDIERIDWVIAGGESGLGARPMHPAWARQIRDACDAAEVAFHFKQWGAWAPEARGSEWAILDSAGGLDIPDDRWPDEDAGEVAVSQIGKKAAGRLLDGVEHNGFPEARA